MSYISDMGNPCKYCEFSIANNRCDVSDIITTNVTVCAMQKLTIKGWEVAVNKAEVSGHMDRGLLYREQLKKKIEEKRKSKL